MAPPPLAMYVAPKAKALEVRCAGCGETLEVDRGLTEFNCPDCAPPQPLPPKPPRWKALLKVESSPLVNFGVLNDYLIKGIILCVKCISRFLIKV
jgi:DNA-directed RNA polymerase subunit RPC12/RpoP